MSVLLDTDVVLETRRRAPDANVTAWFERADPAGLYLSVLTIGELTAALTSHRAHDPQTAAGLAQWLRGLETLFADRLLPIDAAVATAWGELTTARPLPVPLALLAATAKVHNLTLATRNGADVQDTGVEWINPWAGEPAGPRVTRL